MKIATFKPVTLPEPQVRQSLARTEQKQLAEIRQRIAKVADEAFIKRAELKPFKYNSGDLVGAMNRQELRAALRAMSPQDHTEAMRRHDFRAAALDQPAELSGMPASMPPKSRVMLRRRVLSLRRKLQTPHV